MFKSKLRPIVIPQSEHLKLAGTLALFWGNEQFDLPPIRRESFVTGIGLHDRAYGYLDNSPVGEMAEADWLDLTRKGFYQSFSDPAAETIARLHLRRLVSAGDAQARRLLLEEMDQAIREHAAEHGLPFEQFLRIDQITRFCDRVSFEVCFENTARGEVPVYPRNGSDELVNLSYAVTDGQVMIYPWPLTVDGHQGYLVGYQAEGYPERLDPVIVPYQLEKAAGR